MLKDPRKNNFKFCKPIHPARLCCEKTGFQSGTIAILKTFRISNEPIGRHRFWNILM